MLLSLQDHFMIKPEERSQGKKRQDPTRYWYSELIGPQPNIRLWLLLIGLTLMTFIIGYSFEIYNYQTANELCDDNVTVSRRRREVTDLEHCKDLSPIQACICKYCGHHPEGQCVKWCEDDPNHFSDQHPIDVFHQLIGKKKKYY